jgi:hypothetical protein
MKEVPVEMSGVKPCVCPVCLKLQDSATCLSDPESRPAPGDYSICISCAAVLRFGPEMDLLEATEVDLEEMKYRQPREYNLLEQAQRLVRTLNAQRR